ncbi:MAG: hypothetical protein MUP98_09680 [Candidatus Aminicenantes bacterium]|nr:hypothetical protein [Candidatus Aminicenantes bacterium]
MKEEIKLAIADIVISIQWEDSKILEWPHPLYEDFITDRDPQISLNITFMDLPEHSSQLLFEGKDEGYWRLFQNNQDYVIETYNSLSKKKNKVCFIDSNFREGQVYMDPQFKKSHDFKKKPEKLPSWSFPFFMQPLVELLLVNVLADEAGIMAHGLGIEDQGQGIAFMGQSGAGKSTMARLWEDVENVNILSDEHIIIRNIEGQFWLYGTPWPGMAAVASSKKVPLKKIYFIEHAPENRILDSAAPGNLMPLLYLPFWDKKRLSHVLSFCHNLFDSIEWSKLGFVKDRSVVEFIRKQ